MIAMPYKDRLYHFTKISTVLEHILPNRKLLLNSFANTNDPREYSDLLMGSIFDPSITNLPDLQIEIQKKLKADSKLICFSKDYGGFFGFESPSMWAHYGENHRGICLLIDKVEFVKENNSIIKKSLFQNISYFKFNKKKIKTPPYFDFVKYSKDNNYLKNDFAQKHLKYLYFTKNFEWKYENESRLVHFSDRVDNELCSVDQSLKAIYLGVKFPSQYLPSVKALAGRTPIWQVKFNGVKFYSEQIP